jgi:hypothetical protein
MLNMLLLLLRVPLLSCREVMMRITLLAAGFVIGTQCLTMTVRHIVAG